MSRTKNVMLRLTEKEHEALTKKAEENTLTLAVYLRMVLVRGLKKVFKQGEPK